MAQLAGKGCACELLLIISLSLSSFFSFLVFLSPLHSSSHFRLVFAPSLLRWKFASHRNEFKGGLLRIVWRARARVCLYTRFRLEGERERKREKERRKSRREKSGWAKTRAEERRRTKGEERCHQPLWWTVTNCAKVLTLLSTGTFPSPPFPSPRNVAYANGENGRVVSLRRIHREERVDRAFFLPPRKFASLFLLSFVHLIFLPSPLGGFSLNLLRIFPSILER